MMTRYCQSGGVERHSGLLDVLINLRVSSTIVEWNKITFSLRKKDIERKKEE